MVKRKNGQVYRKRRTGFKVFEWLAVVETLARRQRSSSRHCVEGVGAASIAPEGLIAVAGSQMTHIDRAAQEEVEPLLGFVASVRRLAEAARPPTARSKTCKARRHRHHSGVLIACSRGRRSEPLTTAIAKRCGDEPSSGVAWYDRPYLSVCRRYLSSAPGATVAIYQPLFSVDPLAAGQEPDGQKDRRGGSWLGLATQAQAA